MGIGIKQRHNTQIDRYNQWRIGIAKLGTLFCILAIKTKFNILIFLHTAISI